MFGPNKKCIDFTLTPGKITNILENNQNEKDNLQLIKVFLPKLERVLDLSMMALLLGLLRTERLAKDISAVTRVIDIL